MPPPAVDRLPEWPRRFGSPQASAVVRRSAEDFRVDEIAAVEPSGQGEHLWLRISKREANTDWVARQLARAAGCRPQDVGYAGMKDRLAVATQWFSVPAPAGRAPDPARWTIEGVTLLEARLHDRKLRRGVLRGNRFRLILRDVRGDFEALEDRLLALRADGLPNYVGAQRFGRAGQNVPRGIDWLLHGGRLERNLRGIYLSAVRSFLFNDVLARRVVAGSWNRLLDGEVVLLDGTRSVFVGALPDAALTARCAAFDVHPTGPLPGQGGLPPERLAAAEEMAALEPWQELIAALGSARVEADRRSLRLVPRNLDWVRAGDTLELQFELPPGSFATTVLDELVRVST